MAAAETIAVIEDPDDDDQDDDLDDDDGDDELAPAALIIEGTDIRRWRQQLHLSGVELARRLFLSPQALCDLERGRRAVPRSLYRPLLDTLLAVKAEREQLRTEIAAMDLTPRVKRDALRAAGLTS